MMFISSATLLEKDEGAERLVTPLKISLYIKKIDNKSFHITLSFCFDNIGGVSLLFQ